MDGKKFQVRTNHKIDAKNVISWVFAGANWFLLNTQNLLGDRCIGDGSQFTESDRETKGFFLRPGVLTFLKTTSEMKIWFDDVLEVTWVFANKNGKACRLKNPMTGLKFLSAKKENDTISIEYRYETG